VREKAGISKGDRLQAIPFSGGSSWWRLRASASLATSRASSTMRRRVDFDEAIAYLLREARRKRPEPLMRACLPAEEAEEALRELYEERRRDEERIARKHGL